MPPGAFSADLSIALQAVSDPHFLRKLERLRLSVRNGTSQRPGNTPVPRATQASGLELANHKPYTPGDDLRYVDWVAYARLEQRLIKTFRAEREAPLHIVIDASASMGVPEGDGKLRFAAALSLCLAYISLRRNDPVRAVAIQGGVRGAHVSPLLRHAQRLEELRLFLARLTASGPTLLVDGIDAYLRTTRVPGMAVILSDFLVRPPVYQAALERLRARGYSLGVVRLIGPQESTPGTLPRRLRLCDTETGGERVINVTPAHRARYAAALRDHLEQLRRWCAARAIPCAVVDTGAGVESCLLRELPRVGLVH